MNRIRMVSIHTSNEYRMDHFSEWYNESISRVKFSPEIRSRKAIELIHYTCIWIVRYNTIVLHSVPYINITLVLIKCKPHLILHRNKNCSTVSLPVGKLLRPNWPNYPSTLASSPDPYALCVICPSQYFCVRADFKFTIPRDITVFIV